MNVSIIIANRNYGRFLRRSIDSALDQTLSAEVVVVDDGSDDDSAEVIASYDDRIVSVLQDHAGQATAINAGISAASGSGLFLLDSDDWADPNRVGTILPHFERDADLLWLRHNLRAVDEKDRVVAPGLYSFRRDHADIVREIIREGRTSGTTSGLVLRRAFLDTLGPIPERYTTYPDSYLLIRGALVGHGASIPDTLGAHRWHRGSFTAYHWKQAERAPFHLFLRKCLAQDTADIAGRTGGPTILAEGRTWWQLKSLAEWRRSTPVGQAGSFTSVRGLIEAMAAAELPLKRRAALVLREMALFAVPKRVFLPAWWVTHVGRPSLFGTRIRDRLT